MSANILQNYAAARADGARFYAGAACQVHPQSLRYVANKRCVECCKAERLERARRDPETERQRKKLGRQRAKAPAETVMQTLFGADLFSPIQSPNG